MEPSASMVLAWWRGDRQVHRWRPLMLDWRPVWNALIRSTAELSSHRGLALRGASIGWTVLLGFFWSAGDRISEAAALWIFGWTRANGFAFNDFGPFYACAFVVSCIGFVLSSYAVTRWDRVCPAGALLLYFLSVCLALAGSVVMIMWQTDAVSVPHTWFYVMWMGLPFMRGSGFITIPLCVLAGGCYGLEKPRRSSG